jgi:phage terminase large subunit-like protein
LIVDGVGQRVEEYCEAVMNGDVIACDRVKFAVHRYLADLKRQSTSGFEYHFDEHTASKACQFFPLMLRHSVGEFAGRPLELEPWQAFAIWNIFGWKRDVDNSRRFRKVYWSMGRKNGKSTIAAGLCLYLGASDIDPGTGRPEAVGQIFFTATKKEQADVVYGETSRMRSQSKIIAKNTTEKNEVIEFKKSGTTIRKLAYDKKGFDGLNPSCVLMDELHAWTGYYRTFYDTLITGSASRTQPLHLIITTAGDDNSKLWLDDYSYACNVVDGTFADDSLFAIIYELDKDDDPADESLWIKANPNLNVSVKLDYLRQRWKEDQHNVIGRNRFMRYHANRLVSSNEKAINDEDFRKCIGQLSDWSQAEVVCGGVDQGSMDDFAAWAICARFPTGEFVNEKHVYRYEFKVKTFLDASTKRDKTAMPLSQFLYNEEVIVSRLPSLELQELLMEAMTQWNATHVAYDPANAKQMGEVLNRDGFIAARMAQNQAMFNEPIKTFLSHMEKGLLRFEDSELLKWCASNAVIARNLKDEWMFDKKSSKDKIDPIVACVMAFWMASLQPERASGNLFIA